MTRNLIGEQDPDLYHWLGTWLGNKTLTFITDEDLVLNSPTSLFMPYEWRTGYQIPNLMLHGTGLKLSHLPTLTMNDEEEYILCQIQNSIIL